MFEISQQLSSFIDVIHATLAEKSLTFENSLRMHWCVKQKYKKKILIFPQNSYFRLVKLEILVSRPSRTYLIK